MRGLDPRIHDEAQRRKSYGWSEWRLIMDCRVKPGNDSGEAVRPYTFSFSCSGRRSTMMVWLSSSSAVSTTTLRLRNTT